MPEPEHPAIPKPSRLRVPTAKQDIVTAMLSAQIPYRSIEKATGVSRSTIQKISHLDLAPSEQAEKIKKGLRNRWALLADQSLSSLTTDKLTEASAKDLAYIAAKATEMAGLSPPSIVETYTKSMQTFLVQDTPQPVVGTETVVKTMSQPLSDLS